MKFQKQNGRTISFNGVEGVAYTSAKDCAAGDIAFLKVEGRHGLIKNIINDKFYYVCNGTGQFILNGTVISVDKEDVIVVPKGTECDFSGSMEVVVFCSPAFDPAGDIDLEKPDAG